MAADDRGAARRRLSRADRAQGRPMEPGAGLPAAAPPARRLRPRRHGARERRVRPRRDGMREARIRGPRLAAPVAEVALAPGVGEPTRGDTVHLDVVDRWGNMVSATPSGGWLWG